MVYHNVAAHIDTVAVPCAKLVSLCACDGGGAGQTGAGHDMKPQEAMEMLGTCDGRLQALMAEANLLGDAASSQQQTPAEGVELRQAFASVLIESGEIAFQGSYAMISNLEYRRPQICP